MIAPPVNDNCENATELIELSSCAILYIDARGATSSNLLSSSCDQDALDIWYKFTALSTRLQIRGLAFSDYESSNANFEISRGGCEGLIFTGCTDLGEGYTRTRENLIVGEEYYFRIWFDTGHEAKICLEFLCDFSINSHAITVCDNLDNTYDLEVELSGNNLEVGDSLMFFYNYSIPADNGFKIESANTNYTFNLIDLPAIGNLVVLSVRERNSGCEQYFYNIYTAPPPCVNSPLNDECSNAIEKADLTICDTIHVSVAGATSSNLDFNCGSEAADVWYKFTAEGSSIGIEWIEFSDYRNYTRVSYEIYSDNCAANSRVNNRCYLADSEGSVSEITGLTVGHEYYIRIWFSIGQEADFCLKSICSMETNPVASTCNNDNNTYDLKIETNAYGLTVGDTLVLYIFGLNLEREQQITSSNGLYDFEISDLPATGANINYSIRQKGSDCRESKFYRAPVPCVVPPTNDNCSQAIEIPDLSICDTIHVSSFGATSEYNTNGCDPSKVDVWYKFTATSTQIMLRGLKLAGNGVRYVEGEIYANECEGASRLNNRCYSVGDNDWNIIENLVIGTEYYLRLWMWSDFQLEADICIKSLCTAINFPYANNCDNNDNTYNLSVPISAEGLEIGDSLVLLLNNGRYADNGLKITNSVVENFVFNLSGLPATGNRVSFSVFEWNGGCNDIYINYYRADEPCIDSPVNDDCLDAIEIKDLINCNLLHPNTFGATSNDLTACDVSVIDVWYQFIANVPSVNFGNMNTDYSNPYGSMSIEVYSGGTCNNLVSLNNTCYILCNTCDFTLDNLVIGEKYYIRVSSGEAYKADFCIQAPNGNICNDESLNLNMDMVNQATYQTEQTITAEGMIPNTDATTFIAEQSITLMPGFHAQAGAAFHAYIEDCSPPSPLAEIPSENRNIGKIGTEVPPIAIKEMSIAPNPFYQFTTIKYVLEQDTEVSLTIFSIDGQLVEPLVPFEYQTSGSYEYIFEPKENRGNVYFAVLMTPEKVISKKMIFIR